jgi:hypothetical protein
MGLDGLFPDILHMHRDVALAQLQGDTQGSFHSHNSSSIENNEPRMSQIAAADSTRASSICHYHDLSYIIACSFAYVAR